MKIAEQKRVMKVSPVLMMKAKKNAIEVAGMKNAHLKDAVAVCDFFSQLDQEVFQSLYAFKQQESFFFTILLFIYSSVHHSLVYLR